MSVALALFLLAGYLSGAVPYGYLLTKRATGLNITSHGSGNTGSTNVRRIAGPSVALKVQVLDILKGFVPAGVMLLASDRYPEIFPAYAVYLVALATILGHNHSVFLRFRGGKGVNTTVGATFPVAPWSVLVSAASYFVVKRITGYVSMGSLVLAILLPLTGIFTGRDPYLLPYLVTCAALIILRHIPNIKRLISGKELT